ncbi:MAG: hypothetical protein VB089_20905, partial [Anaerolineaceae bacterium]|nr:hypothetical protein [Anaerolineaceae bacterium]
ASDWGVELGNDIVIDPAVNPPYIAASGNYAQHPITEKMMGYVVVFPTTRSVQAAQQAPENVTATDLVFTTSQAWGETDTAGIENSSVSADPNTDLLGPVPIAAVATNDTTGARLVVIGDSDFASDTYYSQYGNADFIINAIDWAAEQDNLISLTAKQNITRYMLPPTQTSMGLILLVTVFVLPGGIIALGISTWLRRRKKG